MELVQVKRLTIVAEAFLETQLVTALKSRGVRGFSITECRGEGSRGVRASEWEGHNVKIETLVDPATAETLMAFIAERFLESYAVIAYCQDAEVVRGGKFAAL